MGAFEEVFVPMKTLLQICERIGWPGIVFLTVMFAWMGSAVWFVSSKKISSEENRVLTERPELAHALEPGYEYGAKFERWLGDHFPRRKKMVRQSNMMRLHGNSLVRQGPNGWLFSNVLGSAEVYSHANRFSIGELARLRERTVAFGHDAKAVGVKKLYFVFSNDKESIYPEFYPPGYAQVHPESRFEQTWKALQGATSDVTLLRFTDRLMAMKPEHLVFCKSGTHMTELASYRVYGWLADRIREDFPSFAKVVDADCVFGRDNRHTDVDLVKLGAVPLYPKAFLENDFVEVKSPRAKMTLFEKRCEEFPRTVRHMRNRSANNEIRLFLLTDSFGLRWTPFLAESVSELHVIYIGDDNPFDLGEKGRKELLELKPDIVVVNFTERFLQRLLALEYPKEVR